MNGTLVLSGGGTGGHVFPLLAVAEAFRELDPSLRLVFVGTARGMEQRLVPARGYHLELLPVLPLRGGGLVQAGHALLRAGGLVPACFALFERLQVRGVLSIGGYAAGPMTLAAYLRGLPLGLIEPNSVPGLANRLAAPFTDRAYLAFPEAEQDFNPGQVRAFGVPIRQGFEACSYPRRVPGSPRRILVLGGSQGSKALNETVPEAIAALSGPLFVRHQSGADTAPLVTERYQAAQKQNPELSFEVLPFIEDMPGALASAELVIGRSGASAVSELLAVGRPSLLVPYPFAAGDHQRINARSLERAGAAICLPSAEATAERLFAEIDRLLKDDGLLSAMAEAATQRGRSQAAQAIAKDFINLLRERA